MDNQTAETTVDPQQRPPDIGPGFEWRRQKGKWALYRVFFLHKGRELAPLASMGFARLKDMQERLSGEELAATLANWAIGRCIEQARKHPQFYQSYVDLD